jgi:hypothetical protein
MDIGLSPDRQTLTQRVVAAAESMGFGLASGVLIRGRFGSPNALIESFGNPPPAHLEASRSLDKGLRDPLLTSLLARPGHMTYGEDLYLKAGATDLWDIQASFGYRHGLSMAIHSQSHAEAFLFGVDRPDALPADDIEVLRLQSMLQLVALHAQEGLGNLLQPGPQEHVALNAGEVEALQKVSATVYSKRGPLLAITRVTSPELRVAMEKLHAQTLPGAVVRAVKEGLIER